MLSHLGAMLRLSWGHVGPMLASGGHLGPMLGHLGPSWSHVGPMLGHLGAHLGPSWGYVGARGYPPKFFFSIYVVFFDEQKTS